MDKAIWGRLRRNCEIVRLVRISGYNFWEMYSGKGLRRYFLNNKKNSDIYLFKISNKNYIHYT